MTTQLVAAVLPCMATALSYYLFTTSAVLRSTRSEWHRIAGAFATGIGVGCGEYAVLGSAVLRPGQAVDWIGYASITLCWFGALELVPPARQAIRLVIRCALLALLFVITLRPLITHQWSAPISVIWMTTLTVCTMLPWWSYESCAKRESPGIVAGLMLIILSAGSLLALFGGSAKLAQLAGVTASTMGAVTVLVWLNPQRYQFASALAVVWPLAALIWAQALFYAETPVFAIAMLLASCFTPWITHFSWLQSRAASVRFAISAVVTTVIVGAAVILTYRAYSVSAPDYGY